MRFGCDWQKPYGAIEFAHDFGFVFHGPGFYLTDTDTVLVIPNPPADEPTPATVWQEEQPPGTMYDVYVWNSPLAKLSLMHLAQAPIRMDKGNATVKKKERISISNEMALKAWQRAKGLLARATRELEAGYTQAAKTYMDRALGEIELSERHMNK